MTEQKANVIKPFEKDISFYHEWGQAKKDIVRITLRKRPKFIKSLVEDIAYTAKLSDSDKQLNLNQLQALLVDIGLGQLHLMPNLKPLLDIEEYLLHETKAGNSSDVIEHYEDSNMPFKFANITITDTNYKISILESVAGSLGNFSRRIRLPHSTVAILCIIHGANEYINNSPPHSYRPRNITSVKNEIANFERWVKRQIVRLFVEYDDYVFDLSSGTIQFNYEFNSHQNFSFVGEFRDLPSMDR